MKVGGGAVITPRMLDVLSSGGATNAQALAKDPSLMVSQTGATLPERLSDAEWQALSEAMADRGTPAVITARMRSRSSGPTPLSALVQ